MGGGEINLETIAQALAKKKVEVYVLTSYHEGLEKKETKDGVTILRKLKTGNNPHQLAENVKRSFHFPKSIVTEAKELLQKEKIDAIHFIGASIIAAPKLKDCGIPLFATIESYPTLCPKGDRIYHGKKECKIKCSFLEFRPCQSDSEEIGKMKNRWYLKYNLPAISYVYNHYRLLNEALKHCHLIAISEYVQGLLRQKDTMHQR